MTIEELAIKKRLPLLVPSALLMHSTLHREKKRKKINTKEKGRVHRQRWVSQIKKNRAFLAAGIHRGSKHHGVSLATARTLSIRAWGLPRMGHCRVGQPARRCFWLLGVGVDAATGVAVKGSRRISGDLERS